MKSNSIKKNFIYNYIYQILSIIIPFITTPYISRVLGVEQIGKFSYVQAIVTCFGMFANLGTNTYGQIVIAKFRDDKKKLSEQFSVVFISKLVTFLIVFAAYIYFVFEIASDKQIYIALISYMLVQLTDIMWFFQGLELFKLTVSRTIFVKITSLIMLFLIIKSPSDLVLYILILYVPTILVNISMWVILRRYINIVLPGVRDIFRGLSRAFVYFIPTIATVIFVSTDKCMLRWIAKSEFENGYYEQANKIYNILVTLVTTITTVMLPRMSYIWNSKEYNNIQVGNIISKTIKFMSAIVFPISFGMFSITNTFVPLFLGEGYEKCETLIKIFCVIIIFTSYNSIICNACLISSGRQRIANRLLIISSLVNMVSNFFLIQYLQSTGAVLASLISEFVLLIMLLIVSRENIHISEIIKHTLKYGMFSLAVGIIVKIISNSLRLGLFVNLVVEILSGVGIYLLLLFVFKDEILSEVFNRIVKKT